MIAKIKHYLQLKRLGYVDDQLGIAHRFNREGTSWSNHLIKTKQAILNFIAEREYSTVVILGSGWLLDVPLKELLSLGKKVILADIIHPKQLVNRWKDNPNVQFIEIDLTGGAANILNRVASKSITEEEAIFTIGNLHSEMLLHDMDALISVNLLSQLSQIPMERLKERGKISDHFAVTVSNIIQNQHMRWLETKPSLLVTDFEEELFDEDGRWRGTNPLVTLNPKTWQQIDSWKWAFDTQKTYRPDFTTRLNVGVFIRKD